MRLLILLILTFYSAFQTFGQDIQTNKLWSSDNKLSWIDFQDTPDKTSTMSASSNCNIQYYFDIIDDTILFEVKAYFDKSKSWKKENEIDSYLLEHEQGHFDICELFARKLRSNLMNFKIPKRHLTDTVKVIYNSIIELYKKEQSKYDYLTKKSLDKTSQETYLDTLFIQLEKLNRYKKLNYKRRINN